MELTADQRTLLLRMEMVSHGAVQRLGGRRGGDGGGAPNGEAHPLHEEWAAIFMAAPNPETARALTDQARAELDTYLRRALAPDTTETWEELAARIVADGWAVSADDCARAMRCTPSMVRRARLAEMRHPETGYALPVSDDPVAWAADLDRAGLSVRQIEAVTGVPKSTVHRHARA